MPAPGYTIFTDGTYSHCDRLPMGVATKLFHRAEEFLPEYEQLPILDGEACPAFESTVILFDTEAQEITERRPLH